MKTDQKVVKKIVVLIFILCFISCQAQKNSIERDTVEAKEIHLTKKIRELIVKSAKHYEKIFSEQPKVVLIFFNGKSGNDLIVRFMNMGTLLNYEQAGDFSTGRIVGATRIGEIVILIHKPVSDNYNELFTISNHKKKFTIINDGNINLCIQSCNFNDKNNSLIEEYCGYD